MSLIDRIFVSTEFDQKFPLATCIALPESTSDHNPIVRDCVDRVVHYSMYPFQCRLRRAITAGLTARLVRVDSDRYSLYCQVYNRQ